VEKATTSSNNFVAVCCFFILVGLELSILASSNRSWRRGNEEMGGASVATSVRVRVAEGWLEHLQPLALPTAKSGAK
jgi:hypothetical protein